MMHIQKELPMTDNRKAALEALEYCLNWQHKDGMDSLHESLGEIRAALSSPQWEDISTAPRDGTLILVWNKDYECGSGVTFYNETWKRFNVGLREQPTHWMPLPL